MYHGLRLTKCTFTKFWKWLARIGNQNKMLQHETSDSKKQDYVVIYGVTNKGGIAFCNFLAQKGYNLILVDKEKDKMDSCVKTIKENMTESDFNKLEIIKQDIPVFDETAMQNLAKNIEAKGRIKFFVNTKNVRLAKKSQKKFDQISHKEVFQMIHENNENFVAVFNVFVKLMIKVENSAFINLSNFRIEELKEIMNYDLMFYSTS